MFFYILWSINISFRNITDRPNSGLDKRWKLHLALVQVTDIKQAGKEISEETELSSCPARGSNSKVNLENCLESILVKTVWHNVKVMDMKRSTILNWLQAVTFYLLCFSSNVTADLFLLRFLSANTVSSNFL